ncbi:hypothetical protein DVA86_27860 [Streptomyces armeniacus]|uniref:DUF3592 domain-containing protein n=1 Tax=Streptomyces armeniacus TaxID=83291 RepID=A0A345XW57_9ACTN|nr:DUF3592 domain-containing protein [Streptomyces armeniacus]AXK35873.1 hypothetical protein DVA86_27860 [Streptomyces armeniacus]
MVAHVAMIVIGAFIAINGAVEWIKLLRWFPRRRRARAVFVGTEDVMRPDPQIKSRAGRFRFTSQDGRTIERTSAFSSFPGPKPGREVNVVYDPLRPHKTAERAGVHLFLLVAVGPLFMAVGSVMIILGLLKM